MPALGSSVLLDDSLAPSRSLALRRCAKPGCETILSRYNDDPDGLCAACRMARAPSLPPRLGSSGGQPIVLWELVAGLLLLARNLEPGKAVPLRERLEALGVAVTSSELKDAVRCCRRRGMVICGETRQTGYRLVEHPLHFSRRRSLLPRLLPRSARISDDAAGREPDPEPEMRQLRLIERA